MKKHKIAIFAHIFYQEEAPFFLNAFITLKKEYDIDLWVSSSSPKVLSFFKDHAIEIINTPNIGKDIVGKLSIINRYLKSNKKYDFLILVHDKRSPQKEDRAFVDLWKMQLLKILNPDILSNILSNFDKTPSLGMIGSAENHVKKGKNITDYEYPHGEIISHRTFMGNLFHLKEFCSRFNMKNFKTHNYDFISGTMFVVRSKIFEDFFKSINIQSIIHEFEPGDVQNNRFLNNKIRYSTKTHAFERLFGWIVQDMGYEVAGI